MIVFTAILSSSIAALVLACAPAPPIAQSQAEGSQAEGLALEPAQAPVEAEAGAVDFDHSHALLTEVLKAHVQGDRFDYLGLKKDRGALDRYVASLRQVKPEQLAKWTEHQRFAFWINVYNAHVLQLVTDHYPVPSIKDIGSLVSPVWKKEFVELRALHPEGKDEPLSLDLVEHGILRPRFEDARVHAAVNCASIGCPPLRTEAFVAERLDEQLDEQVRAWLADPRRNRFDEKKKTLHLSQLFDWFAEDFVRDAGSVTAWVARYAPPRASWIRGAKGLDVRHLDYDWKLNDVPRPRR